MTKRHARGPAAQDLSRRARNFVTPRARGRADQPAATGSRRPRNLVTVRESGDVATIRLYDVIDSWGGYWGMSAKELALALDVLPETVAEIRLLINSPGGEAFEGVAMLNLLRNHGARVVAVVEGLAASAASVVAMAADEIVMNPNSSLMIHDAWGICLGNAGDMAEYGAFLDKVSANIADVYAAKAGGTADAWREAMHAESWYTAAEAAAAGLADRVGTVDDAGGEPVEVEGLDDVDDDLDDDALDVANRFDLSVFTYAGRQAAPAPAMPAAAATHQPPTASAAGTHPRAAAGAPGDAPNQEGARDVFNDAQLATLRQSLGVADDADADTCLAALTEALDERADTSPNPPGTVVMDAAAHRQMQEDARAGREARDQQLATERRAHVDAAVREGRIPPASRNHWESLLAADPNALTTLQNLAGGVIPLEEQGHGDNPQSTSANDAYSAIYGNQSKGA